MNIIDAQKYESLSTQIIEAARTTLAPNVSYEQRYTAYQFLEKTKDDIEVALPCGFLLSSLDKEPEVRHLGLQFVEDAIRFHWNDLTQEKKIFVKEKSMELLSRGTKDILEEPIYIKDKVSRLIVEMMKREWPQQWPDLMEELKKLAQMGETQAELILLVYWRIAEDVATLQNLASNQRRRDLFQALNHNMVQILTLFFDLLVLHYHKYKEVGSEPEKLKNCRVIQTIFSTLSCYFEWLPPRYIEKYHPMFFNCLCQLILDQNLRQHAVECLLQIVSRKFKPEDRKFILSLFTHSSLNLIFEAANLAVMDPLQESNYLFLKGIAQVVTTIGIHLCSVWGKDNNVFESDCFAVYLNALLAFTAHPSIVIYHNTNSLWFKLFSNSTISQCDTFRNIISSWLNIAYPKMLRQGFPSKSDCSACEYSRRDFDSDEEFSAFFSQTRTETGETIKQATLAAPEMMFSFVEHCLAEVFAMNTDSKSSIELAFINWERLAHVIEKVLIRIGSQKQDFEVPKERIKHLLKQCIDYRIDHYDALSYVLTCISGLCCALPFIPEVCGDVLNKLFDILSMTDGTEGKSKSLKFIRKHACCSVLRLCKAFPEVLYNSFNVLYEYINKLVESNCLSHGEKNTLYQSLLLLNNLSNNYQSQQDFINKLIGPAREDWINVKDGVSSTSAFINFIGLHKSPGDDSEAETFGINRSRMFSCADIMAALLNRCKYSEGVNNAEKGGFILSTTEEGPVMRNPVTPLFLSMLPNVFCLMRSYNGLFLPEVLNALPPYYASAHNIPPEEICALLGTKIVKSDEVLKTPAQKMQTFLKMLHELLCSVISNCGSSMGHEFYQYPNLYKCLLQSVFWNLHLLPTVKLRLTIRVMKALIFSCPKEYCEVFVLPLVFHIAPVMLNELQSRWEHVSVLEDDDDSASPEEIVNNMLLYMTTRDYVEAISILLKEKSISKEKDQLQSEANEAEMGDEMETEESDINMGTLQVGSIGYLGKLTLGCDALCQPIVLTLLRALLWPDSVCRRKACPLLYLCVQEISEENREYLNEEAVKQIFTCVLSSIHSHGEHVSDLPVLIDLAINLYEKLVHCFPVLKEMLQNIPEVSLEGLNEFEEAIKATCTSTKKVSKQNKAKRESFRKTIRNIIGKNIGEALKKEVQMSDLKPIFRNPKYKPPHLDETSDDLNLCNLFGGSID